MVKKTAAALNGRTDDPPHVNVPVVGTLTVPPADRLIFYGVLGALGALGVLDWPLVLVVGIGHYLTEQRFSPLLQEVGQAAEAA
jgi:hypothetical protein